MIKITVICFCYYYVVKETKSHIDKQILYSLPMIMMMTELRMSVSCTMGFFSCLNRSGTQFSPLFIMSAQGELGNQRIKKSCHCIVGRVADPDGEDQNPDPSYYNLPLICAFSMLNDKN